MTFHICTSQILMTVLKTSFLVHYNHLDLLRMLNGYWIIEKQVLNVGIRDFYCTNSNEKCFMQQKKVYKRVGVCFINV